MSFACAGQTTILRRVLCPGAELTLSLRNFCFLEGPIPDAQTPGANKGQGGGCDLVLCEQTAEAPWMAGNLECSLNMWTVDIQRLHTASDGKG